MTRYAGLLIAFLVLLSALSLAQAPVPFINQPLLPDATAPGSADFTLTLNGTGFVSGSVVDWNGTALPTTFVSASQLTATVSAIDVATASTAALTVVNPGPGGGNSNVVFFPIATPVSAVQFSRTDIATRSQPETIATGDFNGDGNLDLAVSNHGDSSVSILLGNGNGTFSAPKNYRVGQTPSSVITADFNGDGILDLALLNEGSQTISILLGNGDGTFQSAQSFGTSDAFGRLAAGDFNGDGKLDLVNTNDPHGTISILLGNGDGTFQGHVDYPTGGHPIPMAIGDLNGDGKLDIVAAGVLGNNTFAVLLGNGDGTFQNFSLHSTIGDPESVVLADFDGDGKLDLAVFSEGANPGLAILLGNGDGTFRSFATYSAQCGGNLDDCTAATADINGDGKLDLIVRNSPANTVQVLFGKGDGSFQAPASFPTGADPEQVVVGDFNGDGRLDLVVANLGGGTISVLLQQTAGPEARLSATSLNFGSQLIHTESLPKVVILTNTGSAALDISGIAASTGFQQNHTCLASLLPGKHCVIDVAFRPGGVGVKTGTITITDNSPDSPQTVALNGVSTAVSLSATDFNFGSQAVGTTSSAQIVTLTNHASSRSVAINRVLIKGGNVLSFAQTNTCGSSVAAGASCAFSVTFDPKYKGRRASTLYIWDEGGDTPQTVTLEGDGT